MMYHELGVVVHPCFEALQGLVVLYLIDIAHTERQEGLCMTHKCALLSSHLLVFDLATRT